jgi:uncharacterized protein with HEPN domain
MARNPRLILIDIRGHALAIVRISAGMHKEDFQAGGKEYRDCLHRLVNIADAVNQLPPDITARHPEVPWSSFARFGNFLSRRPERHAPDAAWDAVTLHVPLLRAAVRALLEQRQGSFE